MSVSRIQRDAIFRSLVNRIGISSSSFSASAFAAENNLTITSVYRYLDQLIEYGLIKKQKQGRKNIYSFIDRNLSLEYDFPVPSEDIVWSREISPFLLGVPDIPLYNLSFAFTEMLNNAIDHSDGTHVSISVTANVYQTTIIIRDNGIGIFRKIQEAMGLEEKSFAILELAKGKFTTDPASHTGEGIFFSSKVVDDFAIFSDDLIFLGPTSNTLPYIDKSHISHTGTTVLLGIRNSHTQTAKEVFDQFIDDPDSYGFSKTIVPVRLLEYGDENPLVVSRSQAKRLMVRFDRFENIVLDFSGIENIGQGFADELFRVFPSQHPGTTLTPVNCCPSVTQMIRRVQSQALKGN